ncbi:hypothetical protein [Siccibacter turicensis]|uniref:hypothetical protein n=1 Tax=Siccibacter turicensis TaxID=357233 RepID=UPI003F56A454
MNEREQLAEHNGMTIEFVNWFFDNKKDGCGNTWFIMMAAMWEGWSALEAKCAALAAELSAVDAIHNDALYISDDHYDQCPPEVQKIIGHLAVMQIPEYNAFIAEQRAQGIEQWIASRNGAWNGTTKEAEKFAAQLRNEVKG